MILDGMVSPLVSVDTGELWEPVLYPAGHSETRGALEALVASGQVALVADTLLSQLGELIETREPARDLSAAELDERVRAHLGTSSADAYGTWAYFPWSKRLVHVLPEAEFRELRTSRNRNKITAEEQERLRALRIGVVGLSVGQASAITLAMEEVGGELLLADFDQLALSNTNRLRSGVHNIGINKAVLTAREIFEINPYARIAVFPQGLVDENVDAFLRGGRPLDLLVEECDDLYMKVHVRERARALGIPVVMETSDRGLVDVERFDLDRTRPLFHGLVGELEAEKLRGLSTLDKVPIMLRIAGETEISPRMAASMVEVKTTLKTWPQLASAVALGGAIVTDIARRIALGGFRDSGRYYVDLEQMVADGASVVLPPAPDTRVSSLAVEAPAAAPVASVAAAVGPDEVRQLVSLGVMVASGGNCQPWKFHFADGRLRCVHDIDRSRSFLDYRNLASYLAFGAVVENVTLAAAEMGLAAEVRAFPEPGDPLQVCDVFLSPGRVARETELFAQIPARATNRRLGQRVPLEPAVARALESAAAQAGARLQLVDDPAALDVMAGVLGAGDRVRFLSRVMHQDMMHELRWSADEVERTRDGIDVATLELSPGDLAAMRITSSWRVMELVGKMGGGRALEKPSKKAVAAASALGLITVDGMTPEHLFRAGRALQRVWLLATARGYAFQPMTALSYVFMRLEGGGEDLAAREVEELTALRRQYLDVFAVERGHAEPMLFRLAKTAPPSARALRRRVEDVLTIG